MRIELKHGKNIEPVVEEISWAIMKTYYTNCQEKSRRQTSNTVWWSVRLQDLV